MAKPSIFSKEYEKKMKKRKRTTIITLVVSLCVISLILLKFAYDPVDFNKIKQNMQAWIDSDSADGVESTNEEEVAQDSIEQEPEEEQKEEVVSEEKFLNVNLVSGKVAKAVYIEDANGEKTFENLTDIDDGVTFDISASQKQMLVCDTNAEITLYNVDGTSKVISSNEYVSSKGTVFTKESTLASNPGYLWNLNPKFLNEDCIAFVSNRPYFGSAATKQYLWLTTISTGQSVTRWDIVGQDIQLVGKENGKLKITVDNNVKYIGEDGILVQ